MAIRMVLQVHVLCLQLFQTLERRINSVHSGTCIGYNSTRYHSTFTCALLREWWHRMNHLNDPAIQERSESKGLFMENVPAKKFWLQNNNGNTPGSRPQNQPRQNQGQGPDRQPPKRSSMFSLNRWLLIIVILMLGIYLFQFFNNASTNSNAPQRVELQYSNFYQQINKGNIKTATIIGSTDINGTFCVPLTNNGPTSYHVAQMPFNDTGLISALRNNNPTCTPNAPTTVISQAPADNSFWLN